MPPPPSLAIRQPADWQAIIGALLALGLWVAIFGLKLVNFWLGLSCATLLLAALSIFWGGLPLEGREITVRHTAYGELSAIVLYGLFMLGRYASIKILPFTAEQIGSIYTIRLEAAPGVIALTLIFLTSPCEEIFWRGFLQRWSVSRFGEIRGWLLASLAYAGVHVPSGNFMLVCAALTAGMFWGYICLRTRSLYVCIVSHAFWTVMIFLLFPLD